MSVPHFDYACTFLLSFCFWDNQAEILFPMNKNPSFPSTCDANVCELLADFFNLLFHISESCAHQQNLLNILSCYANWLLCYPRVTSVSKTLFLVFPTVHVINSQKEPIKFSLKILS